MSFREHFLSRLEALPSRESFTFPPQALPDRYSAAAVLLAFWPVGEDGVQLVFTRRPDTLPSHPGQVSFPGGGMSSADDSPMQTAIREAREELGIDPAGVRIMGRLDDAWSFAGHHIIPYVGWLERAPELHPCPSEVEEVIVADVDVLMRPETTCTHTFQAESEILSTPAFRWEGGYVWGLTADILLELLLWVQCKPSGRGEARLQRMRSRLLR